MRQKKKNIRLFITWMTLLAVTAFVYIQGGPSDKLSISRDLFAIADPSAINQVRLYSKVQDNTLQYADYVWSINEKYMADPQRITVLFAILKQNKVRRKVAKNMMATVDSLMTARGVDIEFLTGVNPVKKFKVVSSEDGALSYFREEDGENYVVEIPGYRVNLAGMFELDENGWRDPLVFHLNWANLQEVNMLYPGQTSAEFDVVYKNRYFHIPQLAQSDSSKLTDFLDDLSLLYVNDYLYEEELDQYREYLAATQATIVVKDVGGNEYTVEFFDRLQDERLLLGRVDSTDYALFDFDKVRKILRPKNYFGSKNQ